MTTPAVTIEESTDLGEVARLLESKRIKRVPVLRDRKLVGIVSRADIMRALIAVEPSWGRRQADDSAVRKEVMAELSKLPFAVGAHANIIVDKDAVHVWGHVDSPEQRRAILLAAENRSGGRNVIDHLIEIRIPGYV